MNAFICLAVLAAVCWQAQAQCNCNGVVDCIGSKIDGKLQKMKENPQELVQKLEAAHQQCRNLIPSDVRAGLEQCADKAKEDLKKIFNSIDEAEVEKMKTCVRGEILSTCQSSQSGGFGFPRPPPFGQKMGGQKEQIMEDWKRAFPELSSYMECKHEALGGEGGKGRNKAREMLQCVMSNGCRPNPAKFMGMKEKIHDACFAGHEDKKQKFLDGMKEVCNCAVDALGKDRSACNFLDDVAVRSRRSLAFEEY